MHINSHIIPERELWTPDPNKWFIFFLQTNHQQWFAFSNSGCMWFCGMVVEFFDKGVGAEKRSYQNTYITAWIYHRRFCIAKTELTTVFPRTLLVVNLYTSLHIKMFPINKERKILLNHCWRQIIIHLILTSVICPFLKAVVLNIPSAMTL